MSHYRYRGSKDGPADLMADEIHGEVAEQPGGRRTGLRGLGLSDAPRFDPAPRSFERVLDRLPDGIEGTVVNSG